MRKIVLALALCVITSMTLGARASETSLSPTQRSSLYDSSTFPPSKTQDRVQMAQTIVPKTTTDETSAPVTSTTVVSGGNVAAQIIQWLQVAFGTALAALASALIYKVLGWMGVAVTDQQKSQLQGVIVNGLNAAAAKAEVQLRASTVLDVNVKNQIVADAVKYAQDHAGDTIKALGLDPQSGQAVEAIRARIETALNDPNTPTPAAITPSSGQPLAPAA